MDMTEKSCRDFVAALSGSAPTPGGGGAAALMGAIGTALGNMVGSLTVGKQKYAHIEAEMLSLMEKCNALQKELLDQVQADEEGFLPLKEAYAINRDDPGREEALEQASIRACDAPLRIMELCRDALECIRIFAQKGSRLAVSDAGCGAVCCKAAIQAASLNLFINTKNLKNRETARALNSRAHQILRTCCPLADEIFGAVQENLISEE